MATARKEENDTIMNVANNGSKSGTGSIGMPIKSTTKASTMSTTTASSARDSLPSTLRGQIDNYTASHPDSKAIFDALFSHFDSVLAEMTLSSEDSAHAAKKRRINDFFAPASVQQQQSQPILQQNQSQQQQPSVLSSSVSTDPLITIQNLPFSQPRKTLNLAIHPDHFVLHDKKTPSKIEATIPIAYFAPQFLVLPTPEKTVKTWSVVLFYTDPTIADEAKRDNALCFTLPLTLGAEKEKDKDSAIKLIPNSKDFVSLQSIPAGSDAKTVFIDLLTKASGGVLKEAIQPSAEYFYSRSAKSSTSSSSSAGGKRAAALGGNRPDAKFHIHCYRKASDGYLFLLPKGVFFGFKKPLAYLPHTLLATVSFKSVLSRTFDIEFVDSRGNKKTEFGMVPIEEYEAISDYLRKCLKGWSAMDERGVMRAPANANANANTNTVEVKSESGVVAKQEGAKEEGQKALKKEKETVEQEQEVGEQFGAALNEDEEDEEDDDFELGDESEPDEEYDSDESYDSASEEEEGGEEAATDDDDDDDDEEDDDEGKGKVATVSKAVKQRVTQDDEETLGSDDSELDDEDDEEEDDDHDGMIVDDDEEEDELDEN